MSEGRNQGLSMLRFEGTTIEAVHEQKKKKKKGVETYISFIIQEFEENMNKVMRGERVS
jgi:hypothetical protein